MSDSPSNLSYWISYEFIGKTSGIRKRKISKYISRNPLASSIYKWIFIRRLSGKWHSLSIYEIERHDALNLVGNMINDKILKKLDYNLSTFVASQLLLFFLFPFKLLGMWQLRLGSIVRANWTEELGLQFAESEMGMLTSSFHENWTYWLVHLSHTYKLSVPIHENKVNQTFTYTTNNSFH